MTANADDLRRLLKAFDFTALFIQRLGWDRPPVRPLVVPLDGTDYTLHSIAHKRGMVVYTCAPGPDGGIPDAPTRRRIDKEVTKTAHEHILVFTDAAHTTQVWQWVKREAGKPAAFRQHTYHKDQPGNSLIHKLQAIRFTLDEEERLTQPEVPGRVRQAFDVDRITKRFYDLFKKEHAAFLDFIDGIAGQGDREWYASIMLNRLMFVYFIQKQGFLDDDRDYLRNRLAMVQQRRGSDQFHNFYRHFLLRLFHEGFAQPQGRRKRDLDALLGNVPYLNGGIFDLHELESLYSGIDIPDEAFDRVFRFFDAYQWHLDDRPLADDKEINPDVLGYIFEKYINQKQMGAYYTKEDITGYIARNTILPFLLDDAAKACPAAFAADGPVWRLLRDDPDKYIYAPVRQGVDLSLPDAIAAGVADVKRRDGWNRPAAEGFALPTETWREHIARRQRCHELRRKMRDGDVCAVNDLITHNLDICQFAEDVLDSCDDPELLRAVWHAVENVSVLDPTCGSGAFLFAAINILEPLYEACLERMEAFLTEAEDADFRRILDQVAQHPSRQYFIYKSCIVHNLYGVDIMKEAVEICKLRLFLKLVSQVRRLEQLEPLPDIDFNIRAGNTLVGFASLQELENLRKTRLGFDTKEVQAILDQAKDAEKAFALFRQLQLQYGPAALNFSEAKQALQTRLTHLRDELDRYLAAEYGVDADKPKAVQKWHDSHKTFHWFAEFYGIVASGGFDVIIGNPPWKEYSAVKKEYTIRGYATEKCGNLHGICTERALGLSSSSGRMSFIVQLPLTSSSRMKTVRNTLRMESTALHVISFDDRPGKLFDGLEHCRSVIFLSEAGQKREDISLATTRYQRWLTEAREYLFANFEFARITTEPIYPDHFPKSASALQETIFAKIKKKSNHKVADVLNGRETKHYVFYQEATGYWVKSTIGLPYYAKNGEEGAPAHGRYLYFDNSLSASATCAVLNSSLFYAYFITYGDCFHLSDTLATGFPLVADPTGTASLAKLNALLMRDLKDKAEIKTIRTKAGDEISYAEFYVSQSKPILDEIDRVLAQHYGFSDEELDFILNYDIKYRMGQDAADGEE